MTKEEFIQAQLFAFRDVERELQFATTNSLALQKLNIHPGGGNFLAALGLLCYTEFAGKLKFDHRHPNGKANASANFNNFFDLLGTEYSSFRKNHNVYDIFRCGLAHEYYVKKSCTIAMFSSDSTCGVGVDARGTYYFVVERYASDLRKAFDELRISLYGS